MGMADKIKAKIDIPTYYKMYIDPTVDLNAEKQQCCPFHKEKTPSFSFSPQKQLWRCWGECKVGGDVIDLHKKKHGLKSREDAIKSMQVLLKIPDDPLTLEVPKEFKIDKMKLAYATAYAKALARARSTEDYLALDYIMSMQSGMDKVTQQLELYVNERS